MWTAGVYGIDNARVGGINPPAGGNRIVDMPDQEAVAGNFLVIGCARWSVKAVFHQKVFLRATRFWVLQTQGARRDGSQHNPGWRCRFA